MAAHDFIVRTARPDEYDRVGQLMIEVYSQLEGFPKPDDQPEYYRMLAHIGEVAIRPSTELLVAVSSSDDIGGVVVYFSDMQYYGSGGTATQEKNASGFRLLAVDPVWRGQGLGRLLTKACITRAMQHHHQQVIIHSTKAMLVAWRMYEQTGFVRSPDLDFKQGDLQVYGFRLTLK